MMRINSYQIERLIQMDGKLFEDLTLSDKRLVVAAVSQNIAYLDFQGISGFLGYRTIKVNLRKYY